VTPQEALAQAIGIALSKTGDEYPFKVKVVADVSVGEAVLAALPEGWSLMKRPEERMWFRLEDATRRGAHQERERLRAVVRTQFAAVSRGLGPLEVPCLTESAVLALMQEPTE
jgi:hypothetical protein